MAAYAMKSKYPCKQLNKLKNYLYTSEPWAVVRVPIF